MTAMRPSLRLPDNSIRAALAGVEAALVPWLLTLAGAFVTYVATASAPGSGNVTWQDAAAVATRAWSLAYGGRIEVGDGVVALAPLGLTVLAVVLLRAAVRRHGVTSPPAIAVAAGASAATVAVIALLGGAGAGRHLVGAVVVAGTGGAIASWSDLALPHGVSRGLGRAASPLTSGFLSAVRAVGMALGGGVLLVIVAVAAAWDQVVEVHDSLRPDVASAIVMTVAQLLYLPTLAVWALAWAAGPGFAVGTGTTWSALGTTSGALPAIPVLGAVPDLHAPWALALPVAVGIAAGLWRVRRPGGWSDLAWRSVAFGATAFGLLWSLGAAASGSIGPERMAQVGVAPVTFAGVTAGLLLAGFAVATLAALPAVASVAAAGRAAVRDAIVGEGAPPPPRSPEPRVPTAATAPTGGTIPTAATVPTVPSFASAFSSVTAPTAPSADSVSSGRSADLTAEARR